MPSSWTASAPLRRRTEFLGPTLTLYLHRSLAQLGVPMLIQRTGRRAPPLLKAFSHTLLARRLPRPLPRPKHLRPRGPNASSLRIPAPRACGPRRPTDSFLAVLLCRPPPKVCTIVPPSVPSYGVRPPPTVPSALLGPFARTLRILPRFSRSASPPSPVMRFQGRSPSEGAPSARSPRPDFLPPSPSGGAPSQPWPARRPPPHQRLHLRVRCGHLEPVDLLHHGAGERAGQGPGAAGDADRTARGPKSPAGGAD